MTEKYLAGIPSFNGCTGTHNAVGGQGELTTASEFLQTGVHGGMIVRSLILNAPTHIGVLKRSAAVSRERWIVLLSPPEIECHTFVDNILVV